MLKAIDTYLNKTTMYRLILYYLVGLLGVAMVLGLFGWLPYSPISILLSALFFVAVCWIANYVFAWGFDAPTNVESVYITALILALIVSPLTSLSDGQFFPLAIWSSLWAIGSKYILAIGKKHVFNPAALGVAITALVLGLSASWWVGTLFMLPAVLIGGIAIVRKIRRTDLVLSFILFAAATIAGSYIIAGNDALAALIKTASGSPLFFLAFVMLTEPLTTPPQMWARIAYAAIVGFLFAPFVHIGSLYFTPELALLAGNIFSYAISPKQKLVLKLKDKIKVATDTYDFVFESLAPLVFKPGQYMEWTLAHAYADNRGNRRYFTLANAPTEKEVRLGLKFYSPASTFKRRLAQMERGDVIVASQLAGEFTMPKDKKRELVFIAGGIGITPFRSMIQHMLDTRDVRPVTVLYSNKTAAEITYKDILDRAVQELGIRVVYAVTNESVVGAGMYAGLIDANVISRAVPNYRNCTFYISGPRGMVEAFKKTLRGMGISRWRVKSDFFPGFA